MTLDELLAFFRAEGSAFVRSVDFEGTIEDMTDVHNDVDCTEQVLALCAEAERLRVQVDGQFGGVSRNRIFEMGKAEAATRIAELEAENATLHAAAPPTAADANSQLEWLEAERDVAQVAMRMMERAGQGADARIAELAAENEAYRIREELQVVEVGARVKELEAENAKLREKFRALEEVGNAVEYNGLDEADAFGLIAEIMSRELVKP